MTKILTSVALFLLPGLVTHADQRATDKMLIGATVGLVMAESAPTPFCSGVLISRELVLTAAHCAKTLLKSDFSWVLHGPQIEISRDVSKVLKVLIHPGYNLNSFNPIAGYKMFLGRRNDIALVHIDRAPEMYKEIPPDFKYHPSEDQLLIGAGWGIKKDGREAFGIFSAVYKSHWRPTSKNFDAFYVGPEKVCHGDSGGPIFAKVGSHLKLIGLATLLELKFGGCQDMSSFTAVKVNEYEDWITCGARALTENAPKDSCI